FVSQREPRVWHPKGGLPGPREPSGLATVQEFRWERYECARKYWTLSKISSLKSVQKPHARRGRFDQHVCPRVDPDRRKAFLRRPQPCPHPCRPQAIRICPRSRSSGGHFAPPSAAPPLC